MNLPEPEFVTDARQAVDAAWEEHLDAERAARATALSARLQAAHAAEHTKRPDIQLVAFVANTTMSNDLGSIVIGADSCRYCLAEQAAEFGLTEALEMYLGTQAPPPQGDTALAAAYAAVSTPEALRESEEAGEAEAAYRAGLDADMGAAYDVLDRDVFAYHYYSIEARDALVRAVVAAVYRGNLDMTRGAMAPERGTETRADGIVDIPLFTIEGETP